MSGHSHTGLAFAHSYARLRPSKVKPSGNVRLQNKEIIVPGRQLSRSYREAAPGWYKNLAEVKLDV